MEYDYSIMNMSTLSGLNVFEVQKEERIMDNGEIVKFNYPAFFADHYIYRGQWKIKMT